MALPELLAALEREAEARETEELQRARDEAERLRRMAASEGTHRMQKRLAECARVHRGRAEERLVQARRTAEARALEARGQALERVFREALRLQGESRTWPSYGAALGRDVRTLLELVPGEDLVFRCAPVDCAAVAAAAGPAVSVQGAPEVAAGVLARSADGRIEMDRSLAGRLSEARAALAIRVLKQLETGR